MAFAPKPPIILAKTIFIKVNNTLWKDIGIPKTQISLTFTKSNLTPL